jgi:hypothetical protein
MEYVALPEQIYNEMRRFLGNQPHDLVKDFIITMEREARYVEQIEPALPQTTEEEIRSTGD